MFFPKQIYKYIAKNVTTTATAVGIATVGVYAINQKTTAPYISNEQVLLASPYHRQAKEASGEARSLKYPTGSSEITQDMYNKKSETAAAYTEPVRPPSSESQNGCSIEKFVGEISAQSDAAYSEAQRLQSLISEANRSQANTEDGTKGRACADALNGLNQQLSMTGLPPSYLCRNNYDVEHANLIKHQNLLASYRMQLKENPNCSDIAATMTEGKYAITKDNTNRATVALPANTPISGIGMMAHSVK